MSISNLNNSDTSATFKSVNAYTMQCGSLPSADKDVVTKEYTDDLGMSVSWVPTISNLTNLIGTPVLQYANYMRIGKLVVAFMKANTLVINSNNTASSFTFNLPVPARVVDVQTRIIGNVRVTQTPLTNIFVTNSGTTPTICTVLFTSGASDAFSDRNFEVQLIYESA